MKAQDDPKDEVQEMGPVEDLKYIRHLDYRPVREENNWRHTIHHIEEATHLELLTNMDRVIWD